MKSVYVCVCAREWECQEKVAPESYDVVTMIILLYSFHLIRGHILHFFTYACAGISHLIEQSKIEKSQGVCWMLVVLIGICIKESRGLEQTRLLHKVPQLISLISV